jgi:hypothetical protein
MSLSGVVRETVEDRAAQEFVPAVERREPEHDLVHVALVRTARQRRRHILARKRGDLGAEALGQSQVRREGRRCRLAEGLSIDIPGRFPILSAVC